MWELLIAALGIVALIAIVRYLASARPTKQGEERDDSVTERSRVTAGFLAVMAGDGAIIGGVIVGLTKVSDSNQTVALLTSAFTAVTAITTAYFGIRAVSNTAQQAMKEITSSHTDAQR
ncbi:hypothetical protein ABZS79_05535 [Streptomyces griseoloalbus]|uniref:hypothetical protein n=1 Tax=Streptomyces griseoloalbus TaxID=67303 RepID=UPI0033A03264